MKDNFISTIPKEFIPYQLPENWKWFLWSDLITNYQQGMIRSNSQLGEGNAEYLKMGDLDSSGRANFSNLARTEASQKEIEEFLLKEGDFLINVRNSKELVGKTCLIQNINNRTVLFNHMLVRMDHGSIELNYYINAFLNIPSSKKMLDRIKQGTTTVIALYQRDLNKIPIPLPDNKTFNNIVELYKSINQKIELNNKINAELEAMAKALYDYWFVQFDFPVQSKKNPELVEGYKSSGGKMVWNEELKREIPEGWEIGTISDISELIRGVSYDKKSIKTSNDSNVIPILRATNITGNQIDLNDMVYVPSELVNEKQILNKFDILITMSSGSIDHIGKNGFYYFDEIVSFGAFCAKFVPKQHYHFYLFNYTQSDFMSNTIKNECLGTNINNLNSGMVNGFKLVIPDEDVLKLFNNKVESIYQKISINYKENQELATLRDWLLPMLMNGQVTVASTSSATENGYEVEDSELGMVAEDKVEYKN
ncbi:MAG: restriction endonuclease subunit S [Flavobacterium sp.]